MQKHQCSSLRLLSIFTVTFLHEGKPWVKVRLSFKCLNFTWKELRWGILPCASSHERELGSKIKNIALSHTWMSLHISCLRALRALWLLLDGAVVLWLILSQRRVCLDDQGRSTLQGSQQELPRCHQITVALGVWEGVARPTGADMHATLGRCRSWQCLLPHFISHLQKGGRDRSSVSTRLHIFMLDS